MGKRASVLFVGYDPYLRELRSEILRKAGFELAEACSPKEAMLLSSRQSFDLVLLDQSIELPERQELERSLKAMRCNVPIVVLFTGLEYPEIWADLFIHAYAGAEALILGLTAALAHAAPPSGNFAAS